MSKLVLTDRNVTSDRFIKNLFECSEDEFKTIAMLIERVKEIFLESKEESVTIRGSVWDYRFKNKNATDVKGSYNEYKMWEKSMASLTKLEEAYIKYFSEEYDAMSNVPLAHHDQPMVFTVRGLEFGFVDIFGYDEAAHHLIIGRSTPTVTATRLVSINL